MVQDKNNTCSYTNCKNSSKYFFENSCVDAIPNNSMFISDEFNAYVKCTEFTPKFYKFGLGCVSSCPANSKLNSLGDECIITQTDCKSNEYYLKENMKCSSDNCRDLKAFIYQTYCVLSCPIYTILDTLTNKCISSTTSNDLALGNFN